MEHLYPFFGELILHGSHEQFARYRRLANHPVLGHDYQSMLATTAGFQRQERLLNFAADLFRAPQPGVPPGLTTGLASSLAALWPARARRRLHFSRVIAMAEQSPNPDSRVSLSEERDALGMNRLQLDWRVSAGDYRSIKHSADRIARELGASSLGRASVDIRYQESELSPKPLYGFHHMGTTRMSEDPKQGVVDADCRVHGVSNLFVAGSSTFPTSGYANPTFTLVAMALLLSDHLKQRLKA
jgi:choline dehydrogenase-like flavoprotein